MSEYDPWYEEYDSWDDEYDPNADREAPSDSKEQEAREALIELIEANPERVFFTTQLEVMLEDDFFHWITGRAIQGLVDDGTLMSERRKMTSGSQIRLLWPRRYRYWKRAAKRVVEHVESYADPKISRALGLQGEAHVSDGFSRIGFVQIGRNTQEYDGRKWSRTKHDLDFLFTRDDEVYGVEVKNRIAYMERDEMEVKIELCEHIGVTPVFVVRAAPKSWINDVRLKNGFTLMMKHQLYPWGHEELAKTIREELELPVDSPARLEDGTMRRFEKWHEKRVNSKRKSQGVNRKQ